jgi:HEAT repeat protein
MPALDALSSPSWRDRKLAIQSLAHSGDPGLVPALVEILQAGHEDLGALNAALQIISELGDQVTPALVELLEDPDQETRLYAALALGSLCDARSIPALLEALDDNNPNVCFQAVDALGHLHARAAVPRLVEISLSDDFYLAFAAVSALGEIGDRQVLPQLLPLLNSDSLGPAAAQALGKLGDARALTPLARWLRSPGGEVESAVLAFASFLDQSGDRTAARRVLEELGSEDLERMAGAVPERARPEEHVSAQNLASQNNEPDLAQSLGRLFSSLLGAVDEIQKDERNLLRNVLVGGLIKLLRHSSGRPLALSSLGKARPFALDQLLPMLEDEDPVARRAAAALLAQRAQAEDWELLLKALDADDEEIAALGAAGLGRIQAVGAFAPLLESLHRGSSQLRLAAVEALARLRHPDFLPAMQDLLRDPDPELRQFGLHGLRLVLEDAHQPDPAVVGAVLAACADPVKAVRRIAIETLEFFRGPEIETVLHESATAPDSWQRAAAARALGRAPQAFAQPLLARLLHDSDPWVRVSALRALLRQPVHEQLPALEALVSDPVPPVRAALAQAAASLSVPDFAPFVWRVLTALAQDPDPEVRQAGQRGIQTSPLTGGQPE